MKLSVNDQNEKYVIDVIGASVPWSVFPMSMVYVIGHIIHTINMYGCYIDSYLSPHQSQIKGHKNS